MVFLLKIWHNYFKYFSWLLFSLGLAFCGISFAKADERYFLDYSLAGGGFSPTSSASYYADLDFKGGIFLSENFQIGAGLGVIYYDSKVLDEFKVNDGGFKAFLTMQYNITDRVFAFTNVGIASLQDDDFATNSYEVTVNNQDGTPCNIVPSSDCRANVTETKNLDFKSLGYAELGFGYLMSQSVYFAVSYKVFSQSMNVSDVSYNPYYNNNTGKIEYTESHTFTDENRLDHTISFKIGIYISDLYTYSAEY